ncbi:hypothetical protein LTR37_016560 [Vermiconidia calcicola]|uniref:Uncharacterized protein n=1 Tax=Vermiconidia calcicola TaxID=1690605 RepID=A0ACC3MMJ9_9PEZI|nr:hypothetical protein LTR37_016560 [Vermiconidia calcicola]
MDHLQSVTVPYVSSPAYSFTANTHGSMTSRHDSIQAEGVSLNHHNGNKKLCFYWYHYKSCDRDPANPQKSGKSCPYLHSLDPSDVNVKVSGVPRWVHNFACDLQFCTFKGKEWTPRDRVRQDALPASRTIGVVDGQPAVGYALAVADRRQNPMVKKTQSSLKKRKVPFHHYDDPTPLPSKRRKVDYDEISEASEDVQAEAETCFFWYHGRCSRSLDPRNNYHCDYRHDPTDPPTMVQPPPGYKHPALCGLEWCPGDGADEGRRHNRKFEPSVKPSDTHTTQVEAAVGGVKMSDWRDRSSRASEPDKVPEEDKLQTCPKQSPIATDANEGPTCFFWYHGTCRRAPCSMRHELTDPRSMVQPLPGFVRRKHCGLQWCPGDAKHSGSDHDLLAASKLRVLKAESNIESGCESLQEEGRAEHDNEAWYLTGFDEAESQVDWLSDGRAKRHGCVYSTEEM